MGGEDGRELRLASCGWVGVMWCSLGPNMGCWRPDWSWGGGMQVAVGVPRETPGGVPVCLEHGALLGVWDTGLGTAGVT